jgi:hypothetical protein
MPEDAFAQVQDTAEHQLAPAPTGVQAEPMTAPGVGTGYLIIRLIVGALAEGSDEALRRLRQWNEEAQPRSQASAAIDGKRHLRWLLLGLLLDAQAGVPHQVFQVRRRGAHALYHPMITLHSFEDSMWEWLSTNVERRVDAWHEHVLSRHERWISTGYRAEHEGRQLARHATQATVRELFDYCARNPQVRTLMEQQGVGVADEAAGEVYARSLRGYASGANHECAASALALIPPPTSVGQAAVLPHTSLNSSHAGKAT